MKIEGRKGLALGLGLAALLAAGGCWDYQELDSLAVAAGAALDFGGQGQKIFTAQLADLQKPETVEARLAIGEGASYLAAGQQAAAKTGRRLYFGHAQTVVVSQQIARQDIRPVLDYISRQNDSLLSLRLMVSRQQTAAEILQAQPQSESLSGFELSIRASEKGQGLDMPFFRFYSELRQQGIDPFLPAVSLDGGQQGSARLGGAALFQGPRLQCFLDEGQAETLLLLRGGKPQSPLTLRRGPEQGGDAALTLRDCRAELEVEPGSRGSPRARLRLYVKAAVGELAGSQNLMAEQDRKELESQCAARLEDQARLLIGLLQREQCDTLGFGLALSRQYPQRWQALSPDWRQVFADMPVEVEAQVTVTGAGRMYLPVRQGEEEENG